MRGLKVFLRGLKVFLGRVVTKYFLIIAQELDSIPTQPCLGGYPDGVAGLLLNDILHLLVQLFRGVTLKSNVK